jgi:hypothetical protein
VIVTQDHSDGPGRTDLSCSPKEEMKKLIKADGEHNALFMGRHAALLYDCLASIPSTVPRIAHLLTVMRGKWPSHGNDRKSLISLLQQHTGLNVAESACPQLLVKLALAGEELGRRVGVSISACIAEAMRHVTRSVLYNGGIQQCSVDEMATILERLRALPPDAPNNLNTKEGFHSFVANALGIAVRRRRCVCMARAVPELVRWCPRCSPSSPQLQSSREQNASATSLSEAPRQPSAGLGRTKCHLAVVGYPSGSQGWIQTCSYCTARNASERT